MNVKKITIVVPVFNEVQTVKGVYGKLLKQRFGVPREIIFIDDGSTDGSQVFLTRVKKARQRGVTVLFHDKTYGKGAAIRTALKYARGSHIAIQDADYEYEPSELKKLVAQAKNQPSGAVFGSRNKDIKNTYLYPIYYEGSKLLNILIKVLYGYTLTDPGTCQKLIPTSLLKSLNIQENGFGADIEMIAKIAMRGLPITEVSIHYVPRSFAEGKKIRAIDGFRELYLLVKYRFTLKKSGRNKYTKSVISRGGTKKGNQ